MRMGHSYMWPAPLYNIFPLYLINSPIFEKKKLLNIKCVFLFALQFLSETFLILRGIERAMIKKMYIGLQVKYPLFSSDFNET